MSMLTGNEIHRQVRGGNIIIEPFNPEFLGPNSYDLHLGDTLLVYDHGYFHRGGRSTSRVPIVDPLDKGMYTAIDSCNPPDTIEVPKVKVATAIGERREGWLLIPGRLYIGVTEEWTKTVGFVPRIDGRSSLGRLGVFCHVTAGLGDNGFQGTWTLELTVVEPVVLYPGSRLFQITYETLKGKQTFYGQTENESGRYQDQVDPTPTRIHQK